MINQRHIEDTLDDIKRIIVYYFDTIDYSIYISEVENILETLASEKSQTDDRLALKSLSELEQRANVYLKKMNSYQVHYQNQDESQGGNESV